jgi:hypothetical protein
MPEGVQWASAPNSAKENSVPAEQLDAFGAEAATGNNYFRAEGQNVGNFISDRPSSRVLAPPGGGSQVTLGADAPEPPPAKALQVLRGLKP